MTKTDPDAARRQAIQRISTSIMTIIVMSDTWDLSEDQIYTLGAIQDDLTKARYMLVEHCDPDNLLDELSQI